MTERAHKPIVDGLYCCEVYFGWKILEWKNGAWHHTGIDSKWTASEPLQFVHLPARIGGDAPVKPKLDFDL